MNTKESLCVCLHTAYVIVWEDVTIKASLHNSNNNNNQCDLEDKAELCSMFPRFERLCSRQQEQSLSSKCTFKRMKYEKYIIIWNILLGHVDSLSLNVIT